MLSKGGIIWLVGETGLGSDSDATGVLTCDHHPTEIVEKKSGHINGKDNLELIAVADHLHEERG